MTKILTFLGTACYKISQISINHDIFTKGCNGTFKTNQAVFPIALIEYLRTNKPQENLEVIFFLTKESENSKSWDKVSSYLNENKIQFKIETIPADYDLNPVGLVTKMLGVIDYGEKIILDTTHSFRSIPIMAVVISLYAKEVKDADVTVVYGQYDATTCSTECLNLTPVMEMAEWLFAAREFREYGFSGLLGDLVWKRNNAYHASDVANKEHLPQELSKLTCELRELSKALRLGSIRMIRKSLHAFMAHITLKTSNVHDEIKKCIPELEPLMQKIAERYEKLDTGNNNVEINERELEAERQLISFYMATQDYGMAARLAREYRINLKLYSHMINGRNLNPLDRKDRESIRLPKEDDILRDARNHVAHFGFSDRNLPSMDKLEKRLKAIADQDVDAAIAEFTGEFRTNARKKAVISPMGNAKGALYTILKHENPDVLVVLTSEELKDNVWEITGKAGFSGDICVVTLKDPFKGIDEVERVMGEVNAFLKEQEVDEATINLTGGTSLLGYIAERTRDKLRYSDIPTRHVIAIDRRSRKEQDENPYIQGEVLELPRA
ncbi:MAG: TM1812 family CRISPR-associated protein [Acetomicrobium sp.]